MSETSARKDLQKLQRAILDGLEDVKAHNIVLYDTSHLSPLFERVFIASGTSNRQTRAIASSVAQKVRESGLGKPRLEGEENGEWIIVDCGAALAHVMQPAIRQYYNLEEIWGDKPLNLKSRAAAPDKTKAPAHKSTRSPVKSSLTSPAASPSGRAPTKTSKATSKGASAKTSLSTGGKPSLKSATTSPGPRKARTTALSLGSQTATKRAPAKKAALRPQK